MTRGAGRKPGRRPSQTLWGGTARGAAAGAAPRVSLTSAPEILDAFSGANEKPVDRRCDAYGAAPRGVSSAGVAPYLATGSSAPSAASPTDLRSARPTAKPLRGDLVGEETRGAWARAAPLPCLRCRAPSPPGATYRAGVSDFPSLGHSPGNRRAWRGRMRRGSGWRKPSRAPTRASSAPPVGRNRARRANEFIQKKPQRAVLPG